MTDRSKVYDLLLSYFRMFIKPQYLSDVQLARERLCHGFSMDETFKVAVKCSVLHEDGTYIPVSFCFHTLHSSCTQMLVACRFMLTKSAADKAVCVRDVLKTQAAAEQAGRQVCPTVFVATDNPVGDLSMLQSVHESVFPLGHPVHGQLAVGDDVWHAYHRIGRELPSPAKAPLLHASLKRVFHLVYHKAEAGDSLPADAVAGAKELGEALDAWAQQHNLSQAAKDAVRNCKLNAKYLFSFLPHADCLLRFGTTANEHGNWSVNRKHKFTSHIRPDHAMDSLLWVFFLHSSQCAVNATGNFKLSDADRVLCDTLFLRPVGVPFERIAAQHRPPYIIPLERQRAYTMADAQQDLGLLRGIA
jgi:hypothetical protein